MPIKFIKEFNKKLVLWLEDLVAPSSYYCDRCSEKMSRYFFKKEIRKGLIHYYCESCSNVMIKEMGEDEYRNI